MIMRRVVGYIIVAAVLAIGCKGGETGKKTAMGPEDVVEAFTRHIAAGAFEDALALCDTTSMQAYIDQCATVRAKLEKKDSCVLAIASSLLSEAEFNVEKTEKTEDGRDVFYSIKTEGHSKRKKASLTKEEGEWRVKMITDVI